ncbi:FxLYD domain-containing protein [Streptomyces sp. NBC_00201]|uniref:FxLYD domain-containing protein n=1 Tax=unclassified Streptomyces TaxID=2593676 RepID=UPI0022501597|nr:MULTISPECIES: FxLYD domain-containing protein [unclassified Streptomyces]MCX5063993.1 FxLYD domain-containing protein [Streptomyces sp. NBC_00452]MCX5251414.1 FxLYD domain-containing protein [Streptomyces sp. NBC_00201]MCX5294662.1 FxLYD domain-containing protein [Streptomyces sp. NBC_00183]
MNARPSRCPGRAVRPRPAVASLALVAAMASTLTLVSCSSNDDSGSSSTPSTERPTAPDTASFSGTAPSALASAAASARARASAAAASASAAASSFEASVSAEVERANRAAESQLKNVKGQGNAMSDVSMIGKPRSQTGGLLAVLVTITNKTDKKASYAVRVDFKDSSGKVVETRYVGAEDLAPGEKAQPIAISRKPPEPVLTPNLAKAQRY